MLPNQCLQPIDWHPIPQQLPELNEQSHIWLISLVGFSAEDLSSMQTHLSYDEHEKIQRLKFQIHRDRKLISQFALRDILSRYISVSPENIVFCYGDHGKPALQDNSLQFNLTHSNDIALCVVGAQHAVGIDIEHQQKMRDFLSIAQRYFSPFEYQQLQQSPPHLLEQAFYRLWTCKEAFIKALGAGLSYPLANFDVDLAAALRGEHCLSSIEGDTKQAQQWRLQSFVAQQEYLASVAIAAPSEQSSVGFCWQWAFNR